WLTNTPPAAATVRTIPLDDSWFNDKDAGVEGRRESPLHDDDMACRYTLSSGTTGRPKVIGLTYGAVRERLISYSIRVSTPSWDRLVCMPGVFAHFGLALPTRPFGVARTPCSL